MEDPRTLILSLTWLPRRKCWLATVVTKGETSNSPQWRHAQTTAAIGRTEAELLLRAVVAELESWLG